MPIYEYRCPACETKFEQLIRDSEALELQCPNCGTREVSRLLSVFATNTNLGSSTPAHASDFSAGGSHCCGGGGCGCH